MRVVEAGTAAVVRRREDARNAHVSARGARVDDCEVGALARGAGETEAECERWCGSSRRAVWEQVEGRR